MKLKWLLVLFIAMLASAQVTLEIRQLPSGTLVPPGGTVTNTIELTAVIVQAPATAPTNLLVVLTP